MAGQNLSLVVRRSPEQEKTLDRYYSTGMGVSTAVRLSHSHRLGEEGIFGRFTWRLVTVMAVACRPRETIIITLQRIELAHHTVYTGGVSIERVI